MMVPIISRLQQRQGLMKTLP